MGPKRSVKNRLTNGTEVHYMVQQDGKEGLNKKENGTLLFQA